MSYLKLDRKEFIRHARPLIKASLDVKAEIFEQVACNFRNHIDDESVVFEVTFFFKDESVCEYGNESVVLYQFWDMKRLKEGVALIKALLSSKTESEFFATLEGSQC